MKLQLRQGVVDGITKCNR